MSLRALVFDFDGLILDTERPVYEAWRWVFAEHGVELSEQEWSEVIGRADAWDPLDKLAAAVNDTVELDHAVLGRRRDVRDALLHAEAVLPGVVELLTEARAAGLRIGIASSSPYEWVGEHLERLGLADWFECVACFGEDPSVRGKPAPDLYLKAVRQLGVRPDEAVALEDSGNGVAAAKAAGLWCVAVPHGLTAGLDLSAADAVVDSLAEVPLDRLRRLVDQWTRPARSVGA